MIKKPSNMLRRIWPSFVAALFVFIGMMNAGATGAPSVTTDHGTYVAGEPITVSFTNGPANAKDWIALYKSDETPGVASSTKYLYVDGTADGNVGKSEGAVTFPTGLPAGAWVAYLLENDGYRFLAVDPFIVIDAAAPLVRADKQVYKKSEKISISFQRGPGNAKDWIGIYSVDGAAPGPGSTAYKYVDNTTTGSTGKTDGIITLDTGLAIPGTWVAYLLENDTYNVLAQETFSVVLTGSGIVTIQPDHGHYLAGQTINISFDGGPGNATDWIGVYKPGQRPGPTPSTDWNYVNNTQSATVGSSSGIITLDRNLLSGPQLWYAYFFLNDGYTIAGGVAPFGVLDAASPFVQTSKLIYNVGETISINFTNGPGNTKDWVGIYPSGVYPNNATATLWNYTDGTHSGTPGISEGTLNFLTGLDAGDYTAYLFQDDGYTILDQENFSVRKSGVLAARVLSSSPDEENPASASPDIRIVLENRDTTVNASTISLKFDGADLTFDKSVAGTKTTLTAHVSALLDQASTHNYIISFKDSAGTTISKTVNFTVGTVVKITLPTPIFFESFDSTAEGSLPSGWTVSNQSDPVDAAPDLHNLGSQAYSDFTVVDSARLAGNFLAYTDTTETTQPFSQILGPSAASYVVNGSLVKTFANGKILLGVSGYHGGANQILEAITPAINTTGKNDIYLSFHSLLEQNQDSIEGIEVSTDSGETWSPVVYYLDPPDIIKTTDGTAVDLDQTFNAASGGVAHFPDASGGNYGAFLKAPIDAAAGAAIQPRLDDNAVDGTRVEFIRVAVADNKPSVKFRLFYAGTDSWYFGLDDFGIYSVPSTTAPSLAVVLVGGNVTITWSGGGRLRSSSAVNGVFTDVVGASSPYTTAAASATQFYIVQQ